MGKLQIMLNMQTDLDKRIIDRSLKERGRGVSDQELIKAAMKELNELDDEYNWKWWKKEFEENLDAKREELIDVFHFLFGLANRYGLNEHLFFDIYLEKNNKNHKRQREGY